MRLFQDLPRSGFEQHHLDTWIESVFALELEPALDGILALRVRVLMQIEAAGIPMIDKQEERHADLLPEL